MSLGQFRLQGLVIGTLVLLSFFIGAVGGKSGPRLELRVFPRQGFSPLHISLRAEIVGELTEEWMCPEIVWEMPDGTSPKQLSDCSGGIEPTTIWRRDETIEVFQPMDVPFTVRLFHNEKLLAKKSVTVRILG